MIIDFALGNNQEFKYRLDDITILGRVHNAAFPIRRSTWRLNGGQSSGFYIDSVPNILLRAGQSGAWHATFIDWRVEYKESKAGLRLRDLGQFNIEIPADSPSLRTGGNELTVEVEDFGKNVTASVMRFSWDPNPVTLPLDLTDLRARSSIQEVGQCVNGLFELLASQGTIRAVTPVAPDALLLLGSPFGSQEATYRVTFADPGESKYVGLSDFFVRNEAEEPPIGIKPGYSTAGLATIKFNDQARSWISFGDNSHRREGWLVCTEPPASFHAVAEVPYRVRHQLDMEGDVTRTRFRIWPEGTKEPASWLCDIDNATVDPALPRFRKASFGLFQHTGHRNSLV